MSGARLGIQSSPLEFSRKQFITLKFFNPCLYIDDWESRPIILSSLSTISKISSFMINLPTFRKIELATSMRSYNFRYSVPIRKWLFCPVAVLLVSEKCSCTPSTLRFFTSSRLALEQIFSFPDGHYPGVRRVKSFFYSK